MKRYAAIYQLRKRHRFQHAYSLFALTDSEHGMWLLSNAIAKDLGLIYSHDSKNETSSLFGELEDEKEWQLLVDFMKPHVLSNPEWNAKKLGPYLMRQPGGLDILFGSYRETDISRARREIMEMSSRI